MAGNTIASWFLVPGMQVEWRVAAQPAIAVWHSTACMSTVAFEYHGEIKRQSSGMVAVAMLYGQSVLLSQAASRGNHSDIKT